MRLMTTRTVAAPTQSTSLNGTTQYWSKSSPAGTTFTDDFVEGTWVKLNAYPTSGNIFVLGGRSDGTSGFGLWVFDTGQVGLVGRNGGAANYSRVRSYQSIPLNKWVHVAAQLDMSTFTASTTTSYVMIDGVDVPAFVERGGTNPTALVQAGNLVFGAEGAGTFPVNGKLAQSFITSAKVTQATIQSNYYAQTISPTETSVISSFPFNGNGNDANTTNANNLTANGSAVATNADSPFGAQADGTNSSTLDYGIVQKATFSTNTTVVVQVPEGCTIPTSGGVSAVSYATVKAPYGMPVQRDKWSLKSLNLANTQHTAGAANTIYNIAQFQLPIPAGAWQLRGQLSIEADPNGTTSQSVNALSSSNSSYSDNDLIAHTFQNAFAANGTTITPRYFLKNVAFGSTTTYYALFCSATALVANPTLRGSTSSTLPEVSYIEAENAYL